MRFIIFLILTMTPLLGWAAKDRVLGFVDINAQKRLYVDYVPAENGKPTLVILNGLTYSVRNWDHFVTELEGEGFGILRYDMTGMGRTLLDGPVPVNYRISWKTQVAELFQLVRKLKIRKAHYLGLSYGGGIAIPFAEQYPGLVESVILMAPFTEPLAGQDTLIRRQMAATRTANPWLKISDDDLYDYFLQQLVYSTYPMAEPVVLENPYKLEAVFRMVQGIRKMIALEHMIKFPKRSVHLMVALQDQYIPQSVFDHFWDNLPGQTKASRIKIHGSEHKIPEAIPSYSAAWVKEILVGNPLLSQGLTFDGNAFTGTARSGDKKIDLPRR